MKIRKSGNPVILLFFCPDIDDVPLEGINPLNEPPPPPRGLSENPRKPAISILENTSLFGVKKTSVSPPRKSSEIVAADSCVVSFSPISSHCARMQYFVQKYIFP